MLLDTTFLVDADRSGSSPEAVIADEDEVAVAAITIAELLVGVRLADSIAATAKATQREIVSADRSAYDDLPGIVVRSHRN